MKTIKVYIFDSEKVTENEDLGFNKNNKCFHEVDFHFDETQMSGYWIDPEIDDDTCTQDIIFYVAGQPFITPFSPATEGLLRTCLNLGL